VQGILKRCGIAHYCTMDKKESDGSSSHNEDGKQSTEDPSRSSPHNVAEPKRSSKYNTASNDTYCEPSGLNRNASISDCKAQHLLGDDKASSAPTMKALQSLCGGGYNQTYLIMKSDNPKGIREVFFRCGQWCYKGDVEFFDLPINTAALPTLIPTLQRQQNKMRYYCSASSIPSTSIYAEPMQFIEDGIEFIASEIVSEKIEKELKRWSKVFQWIEQDTARTYFELLCDPSASAVENIDLIANKTYNHGLIIISIFYKNSIYFVLQDGEGDQPLLDVSFPNVSRHGQGTDSYIN
jgi:hypothetical protein